MRRASILVTGVLALVAFAAAARGEEASVLLEAGVYAQDVAGDLDKAIETYQKIVADDAANRRIVAEARFRLGKCYLARGDRQKAQEQFQAVVARYADQQQLVAAARAELARLEQPAVALAAAAAALPSSEARLTDLRLRLADARAELTTMEAEMAMEKDAFAAKKGAADVGRLDSETLERAQVDLARASASSKAARQKVDILTQEIARLEAGPAQGTGREPESAAIATQLADLRVRLADAQAESATKEAERDFEVKARDRAKQLVDAGALDAESLARAQLSAVRTSAESESARQKVQMLTAEVARLEAALKGPVSAAPGRANLLDANSRPEAAAGNMLGMMASMFAALRDAVDRGDAKAGLDVLAAFLPRLESFREDLKGTDAYGPVGMAIEQLRLVEKALREGNVEQAKSLVHAFDASGPQLADLVKAAAKGPAADKGKPAAEGAAATPARSAAPGGNP